MRRDGEPFADAGAGASMCSTARPARVRLLVGAGDLARLGRRLGTTWPARAIAVTGADVRTLRSVQVKGTVDGVERRRPPT